MDVSICIATFGSQYWFDKGTECFEDIRTLDLGEPYLWHYHSETGTLAEARNYMLNNIKTEYVIFLDADDTLDKDYLKYVSKHQPATVIVPSVLYVRNKVKTVAAIPRVTYCSHDGPCGPACLDLGNYVVIGAAARTEALRAVGGFREWPMYEDWDLWLRVAKAGGTFVNCPKAIYVAEWLPTSRNRAPSQEEKLEAHRAIARANGVWEP